MKIKPSITLLILISIFVLCGAYVAYNGYLYMVQPFTHSVQQKDLIENDQQKDTGQGVPLPVENGTMNAEEQQPIINQSVVQEKEPVVCVAPPREQTMELVEQVPQVPLAKAEPFVENQSSHITTYINYPKIIDDLYKTSNSFQIPEKEKIGIREQGGDPTYGELPFASTFVVLNNLMIGPKDCFFDLGSGGGRLIFQVYLTTPAKKCIGIELSETRFKTAFTKEKKMKEIYESCHLVEKNLHTIIKKKSYVMPSPKERTLEFIHADMLKADLSEATIIYMCSTCFPDDMMLQLTNKFATLKNGLQVVTLKKLPPHKDFELIKVLELPTTWSKGSQIHFYLLNK